MLNPGFELGTQRACRGGSAMGFLGEETGQYLPEVGFEILREQGSVKSMLDDLVDGGASRKGRSSANKTIQDATQRVQVPGGTNLIGMIDLLGRDVVGGA